MQNDPAALELTRAARRNFWMNVSDGTMFMFGLSMVSRYTVLPFLVSNLSDNPLMLGLIPALHDVGWLLPQLFTAPLVASMARRKPFILTVTLGERLPFLALGLLLLFAPGLPAAALLAAFFLAYTIHSSAAGLAATAWQDFIARVISGNRWGVFFGLISALGGGLGVAGAQLSSAVLLGYAFPQNVGVLFLLCFGAMVVSYIALWLTVEPAQPRKPRVPMRMYLRGLVPLLRRDRAFGAYLFSRSAIGMALTGHSFITAAALARFDAPASMVGNYTAALLGSQALSNLLLGPLADRWGHKQVLELSTALGVVSLVMAMLAPSPEWFVPVFVVVGMAGAGYQLSGFTLAMAFAGEAERPTYIGLANTALAPVGTLGPLLLAYLAIQAGYGALFGATALVGLLGLATLHWRVPTLKRREASV
jgi:MFS family permease